MTPAEQRKAAQAFVERWKAASGGEEQEDRSFWIELLEMLGVERPTKELDFQRKIKGRKADVMDEDKGILIEHKSRGIDLDKPEMRGKDAHGFPRMVTPYEQAKGYVDDLPHSVQPRWIITSNFDQIRFYDLDKDSPEDDYVEVSLEEIPDQLHLFRIFTDKSQSRIEKEKQLSVEAGSIVAKLYDGFSKQYMDLDDPHEHESLNILIVRLVFLLYAEDAGLLQDHLAFHDYLLRFEPEDCRQALINLFAVLDTPEDERDPYLNESLSAFPYINGGLFADDDIVIPQFTRDLKYLLLEEASRAFDWRGISPTIFGAVFESTLNPETRAHGGMHYTSVENIHRVIGPLFLDDLTEELEKIEALKSERERLRRLEAYQDKLASINILDPACGSGNFLTEAYLSLRKLENRMLEDYTGGQMGFGLSQETSPIKVSVAQFHGIEINDFAVAVARTALWIAEEQTMEATQDIIQQDLVFLPLTSLPGIAQGNALRMDWNTVIPAQRCDYVLGNPPFKGQDGKDEAQRADMEAAWGDDYDGYLDYVTGWYIKAADYYEQVPEASFAFVSTNSICQGMPVKALFSPLFRRGWRISFAWTSFIWTSEALDKAHVHVVIIGMDKGHGKARLYQGLTGDLEAVDNINPYLAAAPTFFIDRASEPISSLAPACYGSKPADGGNLIIKTRSQYDLAMADPIARGYVRRCLGARELINHKDRWCLWLVDAPEKDIIMSPFLRERVNACREWRYERSDKPGGDAYKLRDTPALFRPNKNLPQGPYICIPGHFSGNRDYFTAEFVDDGAIATNACFTMDDPDGFAFGVLSSAAVMWWQNTVGGRLKSDCRFANTLVWNTFPLPDTTQEKREAVIEAGRKVREARERYRGYGIESLDKMYDREMFPSLTALVEAHRELDAAVNAVLDLDADAPEEKVAQRLVKLYAEATGDGR